MPQYCFQCQKCETVFTEIKRIKDFSSTSACECGGTGNLLMDAPNLVFTNPKDTSKWDNFGYRAGFNMEKAKKERRDAEAFSKGEGPYQQIDDTNLKGVFGEGGYDVQDGENPGLFLPK